MRWIDDPSGRFPARPFYEAVELDALGVRLAAEAAGRRGRRAFEPPLDTDALLVLLEAYADDLDLFADLAGSFGAGVEAVTEFRPARRPAVRVERRLAEDPRRTMRLRFTLAHELSHVLLHRDLWERRFAQPALLPGLPPSPIAGHGLEGDGRRGSRAHRIDWLEWQAGYLAAAVLMPATALVSAERPPFSGTPEGDGLVQAVARAFAVSAEAAEARLRRIGRLRDADDGRQGRLFAEPAGEAAGPGLEAPVSDLLR